MVCILAVDLVIKMFKPDCGRPYALGLINSLARPKHLQVSTQYGRRDTEQVGEGRMGVVGVRSSSQETETKTKYSRGQKTRFVFWGGRNYNNKIE